MRPKELLRRVGWNLLRSRYTLRVDGDAASSGLAAGSHFLERGVYAAGAVSQCLVPSDVALALAQERGIAAVEYDPEPSDLPPSLADSTTGVVAVLAHVDHGKTTLLDALLGTDVASAEHGGITQCVRPSLLALDHHDKDDVAGGGGSTAPSPSLRTLAFVDTPGHQVFAGMRAAASDVAELALVLVAVDAGVQPQTREVVRRCAHLGQPAIFAITKADRAGTDHAAARCAPDVMRLQEELRALWAAEVRAAERVAPRSAAHDAARRHALGGGAPVPVVCATLGWGLEALTSTLGGEIVAMRRAAATAADGGGGGDEAVADLAEALVLETARNPGTGASILAVVRGGTLRVGMHFACGGASGRVRSLAVASGHPADATAAPTADGRTSMRRVSDATAGAPVLLHVGWDATTKRAGAGGFEVGDVLRAWPAARREEAVALASYRSMVADLRAAWRPLPRTRPREAPRGDAWRRRDGGGGV